MDLKKLALMGMAGSSLIVSLQAETARNSVELGVKSQGEKGSKTDP